MLAVILSAGLVIEMTPERVREAIVDTKATACYELKSGTFMKGVTIGCFTTPYSRVSAAAKAAREAYKPFAETDVPAEMIAPEVHVHAFSRQTGKGVARRSAGMINVVAVVVMPKGSKDRSRAIQPTRSQEDVATYQNAYGAQYKGAGMMAVFPLSVLSPANEVHIVFDDEVCELRGWGKDSKDCPSAFKLDGVK